MKQEKLGRYRILGPLGAGGMGQVFLAEDSALGRKVAIKLLPPEFAADPERRARLIHEARAASALNHPNIVTVHDLGEQDGVLYVAMEVVDGTTVRDWSRAEPRTPAQIVGVARQVTKALTQAHLAGLVHRDIKPENLMVRRDGLVKVLDFGLARSLAPAATGGTATMPGTVLGTAPYMSPEQVLGQPAGPASDVFSLGTVLYELLTGRHPFAAGSAVDTMHRILHESPEPPTRVNLSLTPDFDFVLAKALSKDPTRRHADARDLDVDLETLECQCGYADPTARADASGPRAIAVLPFKNLGGNPNLNYLGVGLADAVITRLASSPDLIVRATSSVARYENQPVDPLRVAQDLGVNAVLDASFQRAGERFRATARLVETPGGRALWAGKIDLRFEDIFEVQDQVAQGIADAMTARLSGSAGGSETGRTFTPRPEAYELFLRALEALRGGTLAGCHRAIQVLEEAVRLEPRYARAWAELGSAYHTMIDGGFDPAPEWYVKAQEALGRARTLDPDDEVARFAFGTLDLVHGRKREAYRTFADCLTRSPNMWILYHFFAYLFRLCDMLGEGLAASARAHEIDPSVPWPYWASIRIALVGRDLARARDWLERARSRFADHPRLHSMELAVLTREGRYAEALEFDRHRSIAMETVGYTEFDRAYCHIRVGETERALAHVARLELFSNIDMDQAALTGILYAHLGDPNRAFRHLARAVELGNDTLSLYEDPEMLGPLWGDPRWKPFLEGVRERVGVWKREFRWPPF